MRMADNSHTLDRRGLFRWVIHSLMAGIGATLGVVLGGAIVAPSFTQREQSWLPAGRLRDLKQDVPTAVTVRVTRQDGYYEAVEQQVVFLVKTADDQVQGLSSTCTHLGCRISWDETGKVLRCPCHGGVFGPDGQVLAGPPPRPLPVVSVRIERNQVLVQV